MNIFKKIKLLIKSIFKNGLIDVDNYVHFITSSEALPTPLSSEDEIKYLNMLSTPEYEYAKNILIEHNLRLVIFVAKKFFNTGVEYDDLVSIGIIGLIKAVKSYKVEKNIKLATYASRCIENEILMHLRKIKNSKTNISLEEQISVDKNGNIFTLKELLCDSNNSPEEEVERDSNKFYVRKLVEYLPQKEKQIISLRFALDQEKEYTQSEVAEIMNMSQSYISRLEKKILKNLQKKIIREENKSSLGL